MFKLIESEWIKFTDNRKNRILILLLICYLVGLVFYYVKADKNYFSTMEKELRDQNIEAGQRLEIINMLEERNEEYEINPVEVEFLNTEKTTSFLLEYFYKEKDFTNWRNKLEAENRKFNNLILGYENDFMNENVLAARGQQPTQLKQHIVRNEYLIENDIEPYPSPYKLNGIQFLTFLLEGYTPTIFIAFCVVLSIDTFLKEMEEGSYKLYFTQPYSRKRIYKSKLISTLLFVIAIIAAIILVFFIIISIVYGIGEGTYPQVIGTLEVLTSLSGNADNIGHFQVVSTNIYLILGYILLLIMMVMTILTTIAVSTYINSISKALGLFTGLIMLNYALDSFLSNKSILRFYLPLSYLSIEKVVGGKVNASYLVGVILATFLSIILSIVSYRKLMKDDLLGARS